MRIYRALSACLLLASLGTSAPAQTQVAPAFEVASVRLARGADPSTGSWSLPGVGRFNASHVSLAVLLRLAYDVDDYEILNKPAWLETELYDVSAKPEAGVKLSRDELRPRLRALLEQRFHLKTHTETRMEQGCALIVGKSGAHLTPTAAEHFPGWRANVSPGEMRGSNWSLPQLARFLTEAAGRPVVDQTGLSGSYDIAFSYQPDAGGKSEDLPHLAAALEQATGLALKPARVPVQVLVIDSAERVPAEN